MGARHIEHQILFAPCSHFIYESKRESLKKRKRWSAMLSKSEKNSPSEASELIAIGALQYLAGNPEELSRFLTLSGISVEELRSQAGQPSFQAGLLAHFLSHEPTLLAFCENEGLAASVVMKAQADLAGPESYERSI